MEINEINILHSTTQIDKLFKALSQAQGEFKILEKNKDGFHGKYADLQSINDATQQALTKYELCVTQAHVSDRIKSVLGHSSGQHIVYETRFKDVASDKFKQASAWPFMQRYAILAMLNIHGTEDPEATGDNVEFVPSDGLNQKQQKILDEGLEKKNYSELNQYIGAKQLDLQRIKKEESEVYEYILKKFSEHKKQLKKENRK